MPTSSDNLLKAKLFCLANALLALASAAGCSCLVISSNSSSSGGGDHSRAEVGQSATIEANNGSSQATAYIRNAFEAVQENDQQRQQQQQLIDEDTSNKFSAKLMQAESLDALTYLQRYGYMSKTLTKSSNLISEDSFHEAIISFQKFAGVPETGQLDATTIKYMQLPRCGNKDQGSGRGGRRKKRYALQGSKWKRQELTYRISQYPTRFLLKRHEVDWQIEKAFKIWSQVTLIDFVVKKEGRVHIDIKFANGEHGDGDAFDGPGNTLAHAYFPQYGGDAHFDDQEYWTIDSYAGTNIFQVAAHELGHSLGLGHSNVREALMAPFYQKYKPNFKLHIDDILAIQALYGEKSFDLNKGFSPPPSATSPPPPISSTSTTTTPTSTSTSTTTQTPPVFGGGGGTNFFPKFPKPGVNEDGALPDVLGGSGGNGLDGPSGRGDPEVPDLCQDPVIDTVTRTEDGNSYVFKGDYYWLLTSDGLARNYPRKIAQDWDNLPGNLDASLTWADGKTFFFKGNKYWRFRNKKRDGVGYPKLISSGFAGVPNDIDAAFVWSGNGRTYFFKGKEYWRFDSKSEPPINPNEYPRLINKIWNGLPAHINAAFKWDNNITYFFKGSQYYRFNDKEFRVEAKGRPPFPRSSAEWWFGCANSNSLAAQRAPSATISIREMESLASQAAAASDGESSANNNMDWSFYSGEDDLTNGDSMGTHISDSEANFFNQNSENNATATDNKDASPTHQSRINFFSQSGQFLTHKSSSCKPRPDTNLVLYLAGQILITLAVGFNIPRARTMFN